MSMIKSFWKGLAALVLMAAAAAPAAAQSRLFSADTPLQLILTAPFQALNSAKKTKIDFPKN